MTQIFLSWSGEVSRQVARALEDWLQSVFDSMTVWMSENDIEAGTKWEPMLVNALRCSRLGVICLTPDNINSSWLLFEAGALSIAGDDVRVIPLRYQLKPSDVKFPLAQFNHIGADEDGVLGLVRSINSLHDKPWDDEELIGIFNERWPELEMRLRQIPPVKIVERPTRELLEEVLMHVRPTKKYDEPGGVTRVYRMRKRVYDLVESDFSQMALVDDLLLARELVSRRLETATEDVEVELLDDLYLMVNRELRTRAGDADIIVGLGAQALDDYIAEARNKLIDTSISDRERETINARITIATEEREKRAVLMSGPPLR